MSTSSQHDLVLAKITSNLIELDPVCSVVGMGSLATDDLKTDSDLDLIAISWRHEEIPKQLTWQQSQVIFEGEIEARLDGGFVDGIKIQLQCCTPRNFELQHRCGALRRKHRILYDPSGIAAWGEECREGFCSANPEQWDLLCQFEREYAAWKRDRSVERRFKTVEEFTAAIRALPKQEVVCEPFSDWVRRMRPPVPAGRP